MVPNRAQRITYTGPVLFNKLPKSVQETNNLNVFKYEDKVYYLNKLASASTALVFGLSPTAIKKALLIIIIFSVMKLFIPYYYLYHYDHHYHYRYYLLLPFS